MQNAQRVETPNCQHIAKLEEAVYHGMPWENMLGRLFHEASSADNTATICGKYKHGQSNTSCRRGIV